MTEGGEHDAGARSPHTTPGRERHAMSDVSRKKPPGQRTSGNRSWQATRIFRGVQYVGARERRYVVVEVRRRRLGAARKGVGDRPVGSPWPVHRRTSGRPVTVPHRQAGRLQVARSLRRDPRVLDLFLANGVTTVRNMDGRPYILAWRDRIASGEIRGPAIHTAGPILDGDPPLREDNLAIGSAEDARRAVRDQTAAGYDFVKVYTNLSDEAYVAVLETAADNGLPVAGHVPRGLTVEDMLVSGIRSIEHVTELGDLVEAEDSPFRDGWHWSKLYLGMPADPDKFTDAAARGTILDSIGHYILRS